MKYHDYYKFIIYHLGVVYPGKGKLNWTIEMTTKKKPNSNESSKYSMFVFRDNVLILQSDEQEGHNKSYWQEHEYMNFLKTLKEV